MSDDPTPRIAWDSLLGLATLTSSAPSAPGGGVANLRDGRPWSYWRPQGGGPVSFQAEFPTPSAVSAWAVAGHDALGVVTLETWNGAAWVLHSQATALGDGAVLYGLGPTVLTTRIRWTAPTLTSLAIAWVGVDLVLPGGIASGWTDPVLALRPTLSQEISRGGIWLGNAVESWRARLTLTVTNVEIAWARAYWLPFLRRCATQPFFLHWNPVDAPASACLCTAAEFGDLAYAGRDLVGLSVTFDADPGFLPRLTP